MKLAMFPLKPAGPPDPQVPPHAPAGVRQAKPPHQAAIADGAMGKQASPAQRLSACLPLALITILR